MASTSGIWIAGIICLLIAIFTVAFFDYTTTDTREDNKTRRAEVEQCTSIDNETLRAFCMTES